MDSFRNALIIGTTLGAIIFSFSKFFINLTYESIMQDFELGAREARSKHVILVICFFFIVCLYSLILYIIFKGTANQAGNGVQKQDISSWIILGLMTFCMACIFLIGDYIKRKIYVILSSNKRKLFRFFQIILVFSFIASIFGLIYSVKVIIFDEPDVTSKLIETRIYKDGFFLTRMNIDQEVEIKDKDNTTVLINNNVVGSEIINTSNNMEYIHNRKSNYLIMLSNKKFYINVIENIEPIKGDKITLKINNEEIGSVIYQDSDSSKEILYIIEFIALIIVFYPLSMASAGLVFSLDKLLSIKTTFIRLNSGSLMGKIVFKYDDFYVVYIGEQYEYIPKSRIVSIVPKQSELLKAKSIKRKSHNI